MTNALICAQPVTISKPGSERSSAASGKNVGRWDAEAEVSYPNAHKSARRISGPAVRPRETNTGRWMYARRVVLVSEVVHCDRTAAGGGAVRMSLRAFAADKEKSRERWEWAQGSRAGRTGGGYRQSGVQGA